MRVQFALSDGSRVDVVKAYVEVRGTCAGVRMGATTDRPEGRARPVDWVFGGAS